MKYIKPIFIVTTLFLLAFLLERHQNPLTNVKIITVHAVVETDADTFLEDADDPSIWIHPTDPQLSTVICTDKDQGLAVYDLAGKEIQFLHLGKINNVDIRSDFPFNDRKIDLVAASNRTLDSISLFTVNPETRMLESLPTVDIKPGLKKLYGLCLYKSIAGLFYVFVTSTKGMVEQWELFDNHDGQVGAKLVRSLTASSQAEGCVADDDLGNFYLAEEEKGIWKFNAEPEGGQIGTLIAHINPLLMPDIEGLTIFYGRKPGTGYLIASSQGSNRFTILDRADDNKFLALLEIANGETIDGTEHSDGIDITGKNLGDRFPEGVFVAHDGYNIGGDETNFKYVSVADILKVLQNPGKNE